MRTKENISSWENKVKKIKRLENIGKYIVNTIIIMIIVISIMLIVKAVLDHNETPNIFGVKPFVVISRKYEPRNRCRRCSFFEKN